jgi:helix-turn-helix protein
MSTRAPAVTIAALPPHVARALRVLRVHYRADQRLYPLVCHLAAAILATRAGASRCDTGPAGPAGSALVDTRQAGQMLAIAPDSVRYAIRHGKLPGVRHAGRWFTTTDDIERYRERQRG